MKKKLLILLFLFSIKLTYCQTVIQKAKATDVIFTNPEVPPAYPGGEDAFRSFYRKHINLNNIKPGGNVTSGCYKITVKFIVKKDGSITDADCENPGCGICPEFIRVI